MEFEALLADAVTVAEGKMYVHGGGWNVISASSVPVRLGRLAVGVLVTVPWNETNQMHSFEVRLEDLDGRLVSLGEAPPGSTEDGKVRKLTGQFNVGRPVTLEAGDDQLVPIAVTIDGLTFEAPGLYRFVISVDGAHDKRLPIRVKLLQPTVTSS
jgi:hypothetical protein